MTIQFSVPVRNAQADALETAIGTTPILEIRTGAQPADCAQAGTGTLLLQQALPSDWLTAAVAGSKAKNGSWVLTALSTIVEATAGHFRVMSSGSPSTCHIQGSCTASGGGGNMTLDDVTIGPSQSVTVQSFDYTRGNA